MQKNLLVLALLIGVPVAAQTSSFTVPKGYDATEGGSAVLYPWSSLTFRYQESHTSHVGSVYPNIKSVAFRRDGTSAANTTSIARSCSAEFKLGSGTFAKFSTTFANNYNAAGPTTVFTKKTVNLPDWTQPPPAAPSPWTLVLPFDINYTYLGQEDFVWELIYDGNTASSTYNADRSSSSPAASVAGAVASSGTGCTTNASALTYTLTSAEASFSSVMRLNLSCSNAPYNAAVVVFIGVSDPNLPYPGLCAPIRSSLDLSFTVGTASAAGAVPVTSFYFPYSPVFAGVKLYEQLVSADFSQAGLPVALSQGVAQTIAAGPAAGAFMYTYNATITSATGSGPFTAGSVITRFEY